MDTIRNDNYLSGFKSGLYQLLPLKIGNTGKPIDTFSISPRTAGHRITRRIPHRFQQGVLAIVADTTPFVSLFKTPLTRLSVPHEQSRGADQAEVMHGHHNRDASLFALEQSGRRDKRVQIVHIHNIRTLGFQGSPHLTHSFRAVQSGQESMNLPHQRIPAVGRRHSQLHNLMAMVGPHGRHLIDNGFFSRVLCIVVVNKQDSHN